MSQVENIGAQWCILRTSASQTLRLATALRDAEFNVWTPVEVVTRRASRSRKRVEQPTPITPSFVFADRSALSELLSLSYSPSMMYRVWDTEQRRMVLKGVPHFTVFRFIGAYPSIPDKALDPLRRIERQVRPKALVATFKDGDQVLYPDAGFEGLAGKVTGMKGRLVMVEFAGLPIPVQIDPRHLFPAKAVA